MRVSGGSTDTRYGHLHDGGGLTHNHHVMESCQGRLYDDGAVRVCLCSSAWRCIANGMSIGTPLTKVSVLQSCPPVQVGLSMSHSNLNGYYHLKILKR